MLMKELRKQAFVVPIVSDSDSCRENCMYEITRLFKNNDYSKRIFLIVVDLTDALDCT